MDEKPECQLETWAIVEVFGHSRYAGYVRQVPMGGAAMIRIDVPELAAREKKYNGYDDAGKMVVKKRLIPGVPAFTKFLGVSSIFAITPCTKEAAMLAIQQFRSAPITILDIPGRQQRLLDYEEAEHDPDADDPDSD